MRERHGIERRVDFRVVVEIDVDVAPAFRHGQARGESRANIAKAVEDVARVLDLEQYVDRRPKQLSGGQRQRVAIGRAIVRSPDVFLFDEPLSNLDAKLRIEMRTEIKALHRRLAKTIVYVTHDQVEAMTMADRVVVMNQGRIEQISPPHQLYTRPDTPFVAQFIGRNTILDGAIKGVEDGRVVVETPLGLLRGMANGALAPGAQARPRAELPRADVVARRAGLGSVARDQPGAPQ